jgi:predicted GNAT family acetyltransferase
VTAAKPTIDVVRNDDLARYEIRVDGNVVGFSEYRPRPGNRQVFVHTEIDPEYRGQDLAALLVEGALDDSRRLGYTVVPVCPFVRRFIDEHPEYADLVDG